MIRENPQIIQELKITTFDLRFEVDKILFFLYY